MPYQGFTPGDRVQVLEGPTGTIVAATEAGAFFVLLDQDQGDGWWAESELTRTALRATAAHTAEVQRRMAAEFYPELEGVLDQRPDLPRVVEEGEATRRTLSMGHTAFYLPLHGDGGGKNAAYDEGYEQGRLGTHQQPSSNDPAWMADYLLGWAYGIKERSQVPEPRQTQTLYADDPNIPDMNFDPEMGGPGSWLRSASLSTDAGFIDFLMGSDEPSETWAGPGRNWSYDWCRFRRESHCWLPKELNREASNIAGYAVWVPEDRGHCKRVSWEDQQACPVPSQPGPNVPGGFTDATVAWEDGGQRGGVPASYATDKIAAKDDDSFAWHYTAAWADVQDKAIDIARGGKVRVLSVQMYDELHPETFYGQVASPTGEVYDTGLQFVPGSWRVAFWECTCKWAQYAWGRTRQWVKFEGRMCSHALALVYEMQSRGMSGMPDSEDEIAPDWVPKAAARDKVTREDFPVVQAMLDTGAPVAKVHAALHRLGMAEQKVAVKGRVRGKINGVVQDLEFDDGQVFLHGQPYDGPILYPDYDPFRGLTASLTTESDMVNPTESARWNLSTPTEPVVHEADMTTTAGAVFSRSEQDEIINEGEGHTASNLDSLDLDGTHYVQMEEPDDDPTILW